MSSKSKYPILENRPIDQWRVTELKDELKRRKLPIRGLKEDLIKRLDESLRIERENAEETNGVDDAPPVTDTDNNQEHASIVSETTKETNEDATVIEKVDGDEVQVEKNDSTAAVDEAILRDGVSLNGSPRVEEGSAVHVTTLETNVTVAETVATEGALSVEGLQNMETKDNEDSKPQSEVEESKSQLDSKDSKLQMEIEDTQPQLVDVNMEAQVKNENLKSQHANLGHDSSDPDNQVSEVSPVIGSQVRTDSISTDSVTINEMIELKENISADHVKLELDVKQEMVEPSSSIVVPDAGESHPMDVEEPPVNKNVEESPANRDVLEAPVNKDVVDSYVKDVVQPFVKEDVEEKHDIKDMITDLHEKHGDVDVGLSEKLNLDRSSGDDSIEDAMEIKTDSGNNPEEMGEKNVKIEGPISKEEKFADIAVRGSTADKKNLDIESDVSSLPAEKRKILDQVGAGNTESVKRHRRWNAENLKIPEPQNAVHTSTSNSKDILQSTAPKRNFSRSDSTASEDPSKERVVLPSPKPPTNSLRIDRFLRPFTLKAVQELLSKTGSITSFWMDHIKTHCYVTYSSVEEAMKTRDAVYNLQWPPNGGRLLIAEFVDPQEVKIRVGAPQTPTPATVAPPVSTMPPPKQPEPSPRLPRQQHAPPPSLPPPPPTNNLPQAREQLPLPPPPALPDKVDTPIVTLDDLFRKTKATPRIYYLPLSDEQVQGKLAAGRGKDIKQ
ncbi:apoptotic chromatin condensation inducer in the nucleus-like [Cucurbita moschata]|uniref:Apoptotic chromatin condensation inducer in the nucleus-like n=1 Tax=Cucurbita moschata TaxID=3662 RepID=A0A6J1FU38_CUCMO|nr:apoptotic chromatin condensation inducer in the nucleus-like [Cucurbita moschata]XP_022942163.1 apoptotic chromatin condensation inducer in the nucleus-like [Cucurbita moschata]